MCAVALSQKPVSKSRTSTASALRISVRRPCSGDRETGRPLANAIVWQDRRTAEVCEGLTIRGLEDTIRQTTGLVIDPYFSATKLRWLLDAVQDGQARAEDGDICFGTVDSWLMYRLTVANLMSPT